MADHDSSCPWEIPFERPSATAVGRGETGHHQQHHATPGAVSTRTFDSRFGHVDCDPTPLVGMYQEDTNDDRGRHPQSSSFHNTFVPPSWQPPREGDLVIGAANLDDGLLVPQFPHFRPSNSSEEIEEEILPSTFMRELDEDDHEDDGDFSWISQLEQGEGSSTRTNHQYHHTTEPKNAVTPPAAALPLPEPSPDKILTSSASHCLSKDQLPQLDLKQLMAWLVQLESERENSKIIKNHPTNKNIPIPTPSSSPFSQAVLLPVQSFVPDKEISTTYDFSSHRHHHSLDLKQCMAWITQLEAEREIFKRNKKEAISAPSKALSSGAALLPEPSPIKSLVAASSALPLDLKKQFVAWMTEQLAAEETAYHQHQQEPQATQKFLSATRPSNPLSCGTPRLPEPIPDEVLISHPQAMHPMMLPPPRAAAKPLPLHDPEVECWSAADLLPQAPMPTPDEVFTFHEDIFGDFQVPSGAQELQIITPTKLQKPEEPSSAPAVVTPHSTTAGVATGTTGTTPTGVYPGPMDVIFGRGRRGANSQGNLLLHKLLKKHNKEYHKSNKAEKSVVSQRIYDCLRKAGCRFLVPSEDQGNDPRAIFKTAVDRNYRPEIWIEVDELEARKRIAHQLRNRKKTCRKKKKK